MTRTWRRFSPEEKAEIWDRIGAGETVRSVALSMGRKQGAVRALVAKTGGIRPRPSTPLDPRFLSLAEREEVSRGLVAGESCRAIAARLGRAPSTISREVARNGGAAKYRASRAEAATRVRARRPKAAKLATCPKLRRLVEKRLREWWSPEQIDDVPPSGGEMTFGSAMVRRFAGAIHTRI